MTLWLLVGLSIGWVRRLLGYAPVDENDVLRMWDQGTPVTVTTTPMPWIGTVTTTANTASVTYTTWTQT